MIDEKKAFDLLMEAAPDVAEKIREYVAKEIRLYAAAVLAATPEAGTGPRWIPCKEALPEKNIRVLTSISGTDLIHLQPGETLEEALERCRKAYTRVSIGFYGSDGWYGPDGFPEIAAPCAWMKLPEPYEEEEA